MKNLTGKSSATAVKVALLLAIIHAPLTTNAQLATYYREDSVLLEKGILTIRATVLNEPTVNRAIELIDQNEDLKTIRLVDIPGGMYIPEKRLSWYAQDRTVIVEGWCYSACAMVALSAHQLLMRQSASSRATALAIHGTFDVSTGAWQARGLREADFLVERLSAIPKQIIEEALSYKSSSSAALYIFMRPQQSLSDKSNIVQLCSSLPTDCRGIPNVSLSNLKIGVDDTQ